MIVESRACVAFAVRCDPSSDVTCLGKVTADTSKIAGWAYFALIVAALVLTLLHGWWRTIALIPTLYLAAFVWENKLVQQVSGATRLILLGALLVVIMNVRPSGIFGTSRVEIV